MKSFSIDSLTIIVTISILVVILLFIMFIMVPRQGCTRIKFNYIVETQRILAEAIENYYADYNVYPEMMFNKELQKHASWKLYTVQTGDTIRRVAGITTPVAYVKHIFCDPFANRKNIPYRYYTNGKGWILFSPGPDTDSNIDPAVDFDTSISQPSPHLINLKTYNVTNGTTSAGDIWTLKVGTQNIVQSQKGKYKRFFWQRIPRDIYH